MLWIRAVRNIHALYNFDPVATDEEIHAASLQYVRKVSRLFTKPSQANTEAFDEAVAAVSRATAELLGKLVTNAPPKDREIEAARARARAAKRYVTTPAA